MSILDRIKQQSTTAEKPKLFGVIAGNRVAGKTTLAGTLPGKTLLLQTAVYESGCESAKALAKKLGHELTAFSFENIPELKSIIKELAVDTIYDHVVLDSVGALTEMKLAEPATQAMQRKDNWAAWRAISEETNEIIMALKSLTYPSKTKKAKTAWVTIATETKHDANGMPIDVTMVAKGQASVSHVSRYGSAVLSLAFMQGEKGPERKLITKTNGVFVGRIEGVLDQDNPGVIAPNLNEVLKLVQSTK